MSDEGQTETVRGQVWESGLSHVIVGNQAEAGSRNDRLIDARSSAAAEMLQHRSVIDAGPTRDRRRRVARSGEALVNGQPAGVDARPSRMRRRRVVLKYRTYK